MERLQALPPVVDAGTRLLILGSLPSALSLAAREYYGNPRNHFWALIGSVIDVPEFAALPYAERLGILRERGIGLWDAIAEAEREGSADATLRHVVPADLTGLAKGLPQLRVIAFNGERSERLAMRHHPGLAERYTLLRLPQSSPARAMPPGEKMSAWAVLRAHLQSCDRHFCPDWRFSR
jgi:TDG/mug DNA glycosylase family protein